LESVQDGEYRVRRERSEVNREVLEGSKRKFVTNRKGVLKASKKFWTKKGKHF